MFDLNVGSLTSFALGDLFLMSIQNADTLDKLQGSIVELSVVEGNNIPHYPQDNNSFIADTIIRNPIRISMRVFVYSYQFDNFNVALSNAQSSEGGFIINGINDSYKNMRLLEKSYSETNQVGGGVFYNLDFEESIIIQGYNETMSVSQVKNLQDSAKQESGTKISSKNQSVAKKIQTDGSTMLNNILGN